jgi:ActR/RegA family two-component response regulator/anti-sigma regulatory factor (Ser/Thr protein kinase)
MIRHATEISEFVGRFSEGEAGVKRLDETLKSLLVVDDDTETLSALRRTLPDVGWRIAGTDDPTVAASMLRDAQSDVLLLNLDLVRTGGLNLLWLLRQVRPRTRMILITPARTSDDIIHAIREHAFSFFSKPFLMESVAEMIVRAAAAVNWEDGIEVLSASAGWISLRLRCRKLTADRLVQFFRELDTTLSGQERQDVATAFREMLFNAIEHGGQFDPHQTVNVSCFRVTKAIIYLIQDPGAGFSFEHLTGAANSRSSDPSDSQRIDGDRREIRAGNSGILIARKLVDEVIHSEKGNEVLLIKYVNT